MKSNFNKSLLLVLVHEGGWVNDPDDPGGATMRGVTQAVYDAYRDSKERSRQTVRLISDYEIDAIYHDQYWAPIKGDDLPSGIDYAAFDGAVNSGVKRGSEWLQYAVGAGIDGHVGVLTLAAAQNADAAVAINKMLDKRLLFLKSLKIWAKFGRGWADRVAGVRRDAIKMAALKPLPIIPPDVPASGPSVPVQPFPAPDDPGVPSDEEGPATGILARLAAWWKG